MQKRKDEKTGTPVGPGVGAANGDAAVQWQRVRVQLHLRTQAQTANECSEVKMVYSGYLP